MAGKSGTEPEGEPSTRGVRVWGCAETERPENQRPRTALGKPIWRVVRRKRPSKRVTWFITESDKNKRKQMNT